MVGVSVINSQKNKNTIVTALVNKEQIQKYESEYIVEKTFGGSLPAFLTAFLNDKKLTEKEVCELKKMIEEASK